MESTCARRCARALRSSLRQTRANMGSSSSGPQVRHPHLAIRRETCLLVQPDHRSSQRGYYGSNARPDRQLTGKVINNGPLSGVGSASTARRPVKTILLVKKPDDERTRQAMVLVLDHLLSSSLPAEPLRLLLERPAFDDLQHHHPAKMSEWTTSRPDAAGPSISILEEQSADTDQAHPVPALDLVITIGGDGTVLHVSSLFDRPGAVPPILAFSMGNLGFLLPFHIDSYRKTLDTVLTASDGLGHKILNRMRIACEVFDQDGKALSCLATRGGGGWQVMNEVALHRGRHPHLSVVDAFVNGQHLTEAVADGLILATPTGSTAYSLSAGGPIAHPSVNSFLLTPIAPRSLSFRTVLLPGEAEVTLQISKQSRAPSELSIDGREVCILHPGDYVRIKQSAYPMPCITRAEKGDDWVADINQLLQFNAGFKNKSLWQGHTVS